MDDPSVLICDVSPRDGLQNEATILLPEQRAELSVRLADAGVQRVEVASFVHPDRVPPMAGAEEVIAALPDRDCCEWSGLALNARGFDRALAAGLKRVNYTIAVTDAFSLRNQGTARDEAEAAAVALTVRAREAGVRLTVTLAVSFGCPFAGRVPASATLDLAHRVVSWGVDEVVLADTIGVAVPRHVRAILSELVAGDARVGLHLHDTRNTAIANCMTALEAGVTLFDASAGGTGGCPFAPGAGGNLATEDLVYALEESGVPTGVDLDELIRASEWLGAALGRPLPSSVARAGGFLRRAASVSRP